MAEIGDKKHRIEIIDWYHLMENLHKIETKKKDLLQLQAYLWYGEVEISISYLKKLKAIGGSNFCNYLKKHQSRIVNYHYFQWQKADGAKCRTKFGI